MLVEMEVAGLTIDSVNNAPIVMLRDSQGSRIVPIWIGAVEASAIAFELEDIKLPRPMTHDLLKETIERLGAMVDHVAVVDLKSGTYYAVVEIRRGDEAYRLDARPSDAIALALRTQSKILCEEHVIEQAQVPKSGEDKEPTAEEIAEAARTRKEDEEQSSQGPKPIVDLGGQGAEEILANLKPEDFGKYKM